jgi:hypothetical protein
MASSSAIVLGLATEREHKANAMDTSFSPRLAQSLSTARVIAAAQALELAAA